MAELLAEFTPVDINAQPVFEAYADIDAFSAALGKVMGKNDLWIAATAKVTGALLLTADLDFDHLHGHQLKREWFDPEATH